jgi:hypothetical protein
MVGAAGSGTAVGCGSTVGWGSAAGSGEETTGAQAVTTMTMTKSNAIREPYFIVLSPFSISKLDLLSKTSTKSILNQFMPCHSMAYSIPAPCATDIWHMVTSEIAVKPALSPRRRFPKSWADKGY